VKIVVAFDKFKGSLTGSEACRIAAGVLRAKLPGAKIIEKPMADGGEGTAQALIAAGRGEWVPVRVLDPLGREIEAGFGWLADSKTAVVEMASASGLALLKPEERNPMLTSTFGTGQLLRAAIERGAEHILLGVGGSATIDGGVGAATALGWQFISSNDHSVDENNHYTLRNDRSTKCSSRTAGLGGQNLTSIGMIIPPKCSFPKVEVLCDVDNPLCGPTGAAAVFGPQKGASPEMVRELDRGLQHLAGIVRAQLGKDILTLPGGGAAGGLATGMVAFLDARLVSGVEAVMEASGLEDAIRGADWILTGEGKLDSQSWRGKVVSGVLGLAKKHHVRVAVAAGSVEVAEEECRARGVDVVTSLREGGVDVEQAMHEAPHLLAQAVERLATGVFCQYQSGHL
jgi:glycerate kinase